jgi:hypothetical protein
MTSEGKNGVLMLTRNRLYLYEGVTVLALDLPGSVVRDLDIKDRDGLFNLIVAFILNHKLIPAQIYFVLAESVCFSKDITVDATSDPVKLDEAVLEFTETIPFSSVISKTYKTPTVWRVIGANQDLIDTIFEAFASRGFGLSALVPASIFPDLAVSVDLTPQKAQIVLAKKDLAVSNSMVGEQQVSDQQLTTTRTAIPKNKILPYLIVAFVVLVVILVVLIIKR